jgi:tRNA(Arg) A34 adenosine deaminase TadA
VTGPGAQRAFTVALPDWLDEQDLIDLPASFDDAEQLAHAIRLADANVRERTGGPFGATITGPNGLVIAAGVNLARHGGSSVLHAEIVAILRAQAALDSFILPAGHTLFTSCEPCAMCLGAVHWSGLDRVVWAATRADAEAAGFDEGPVFPESHAYLRERDIVLDPGPLRGQAAAVLHGFIAGGGSIYNA